jgi:hypothetical protein
VAEEVIKKCLMLHPTPFILKFCLGKIILKGDSEIAESRKPKVPRWVNGWDQVYIIIGKNVGFPELEISCKLNQTRRDLYP